MKPILNYFPSVEEFIKERKRKGITVICGSNNCGKSYLLKLIHSKSDEFSFLLSCQRFSNVQYLNSRQNDEKRLANLHRNVMNSFMNNNNSNEESNHLNLEQIITSLDNTQREKLFQISGDLLGSKIELKSLQNNNIFSSMFVEIDGHNLAFASAGTRLLMTIIGVLLENKLNAVLIDEPEIGLTPRIQNKLAEILFSPEKRAEYFPHLREIFISTHSHIFLDRVNINNNYSLIRESDFIVKIDKIKNPSEFNALQFNLLGNTFETLFLPSAFVIVEGKSDYEYIKKILSIQFSGFDIACFQSNGDGRVRDSVNILKSLLGDISRSPYKDRIFVIFDKKISIAPTSLVSQGIKSENIIQWEENGIEFYYPEDVISGIFACSFSDYLINLKTSLEQSKDKITINGITRTKDELAKEVILKIDSLKGLNEEFKNKFINPLSLAINYNN